MPRPFAIIITFLLVQSSLSQTTRWHIDYREAERQSFLERKFILLYFDNSTSDLSQRVQLEVWNQPSIQKLLANLTCARIDFDHMRKSRNLILKDINYKLFMKYKVLDLPTIIIIDPLGIELVRLTGLHAAKDVENTIRSLPKNVIELFDVLKQLSNSPHNVSLQLAVANVYQKLKMPDVSNKYLEPILGADTINQDSQLSEQVKQLLAINVAAMGKTRTAITLFETQLDEFPNSPSVPLYLYMLTKLYLQDLNDIKARDYLAILQRNYPTNPYTRRAEELFTHK